MSRLNYANINGVLYDVVPEAFSNIADAYDPASTYKLGELVIYQYNLYKCTTAITTAEAWNASHWTATPVSEILPHADSNGDYVITQTNGNMALISMNSAMLSLFGLSVVDGAINITYQN